MNIADLDEVVYDLEVDGEQVREQIARKVWESGGFATVACVFRDKGKDGAWKRPKLALARFRRAGEGWKRLSSLTISGAEATDLGATLTGWRERLAGDEGDSD